MTSRAARDGDDPLVGPGDRNYLQAYSGDDVLDGRRGSDILNGGCRRDRLRGGASYDFMKGNRSDDYLVGGRGPDYLDPGQGDDVIIDRRDPLDRCHDCEYVGPSTSESCPP